MQKKSILSMVVASAILTGCNADISEGELSENLVKILESKQPRITSELHNISGEVSNYEYVFENALVDLYEPNDGDVNATITIKGSITSEGTPLQDEDVLITFHSTAYVDYKNENISLRNTKIDSIDLSSVYLTYYKDIESSLYKTLGSKTLDTLTSSPLIELSDTRFASDYFGRDNFNKYSISDFVANDTIQFTVEDK